MILAISAAGAVAFLKLGRAEDPTFTVKSMTIVSAWPTIPRATHANYSVPF